MADDDTFKILVASDIHLGYKEKDKTLEEDSFNSFREVFQIAKQREVDFVLLGGDLFHENKPSRKTLHSCMEIMRKHCLGNRPCQVQVLSDQAEDFGHTSTTITSVNYEDPNVNISMPVFSVHGNHDDPTGTELLSAIDLMSVAGFLNHFGRYRSRELIKISPVLLKKGSSKIALYGLGSIRDERLHRMFLKQQVKFLRPKETKDDWYNIMVIHQNRAKHGPTNYIPEQFLDDFLDLVVWGHEHECIGEMEYNSSQNFHILQPGSTVATSLAPGESKKKHVTLLEIRGKAMRSEFIPLQTVRNMYVEDIILKNVFSSPTTPTIEADVVQYCKVKVESILDKAKNELSGHPKQPKKPLIRLRIDRTEGYPVFNAYRLGAHFTDTVANPDSIVHFLKKPATRIKSENQDMKDMDALVNHEVVDKVNVEDFVEHFLSSKEKEEGLSLLSAKGISSAVKEFVVKKEKDAVYDICEHQLNKINEHLKTKKPNVLETAEIVQEIGRYKEEKMKIAVANGNVDDCDNEESVKKILERAKQQRTILGISGPSAEMDSDDDQSSSRILDSEQDPSSARGKRGRGRSARGSTRGRGRGRGSRGSKAAKTAIPLVESVSTKRANIMDAFPMASQKRTSVNTQEVIQIDESDDDDDVKPGIAQTTSRKSKPKRARGAEFDSDDDNHNPFGSISAPKKRR